MAWLKDSLREFWERGDKLLLLLCLAASGYGLVLIYSATRYIGGYRMIVVQGAAVLIGVLAYFLMSSVDMDLFAERSWKLLLLFNLGFNLLVRTPFGVERGGNLSWVRFPGLPVDIQPAEVTKLTFILLFAYHCARLQKRGISKISSILFLAAHLGVTAGVIGWAAGDFGMVLVYLFLFAILCWSAGVKLRWFALGGAAVAGAGFVIWPRIAGTYLGERFTVVIDHLRGNEETLYAQTMGRGWQQSRSILAIGSGGLTGQGYLKGAQTQSPYEFSLNARSTDEIFAVCGEELGMVGCIVIILLLVAIVIRCVWVAHRAPSPMTAMMTMGYAGMILFQSVLNIGMCLYVLPIVGLTLPFFSYGGSSIITMFAAMGAVSSVKTRSLPSWLKDRSAM